MAGAVAATLLSRYAVPVLYYSLARRGRAAELQREGTLAAPPPWPPAGPVPAAASDRPPEPAAPPAPARAS